MIVPITEENLMDAARVHAASWQSSHRSICSPGFAAAHTAERQAAYLRGELQAGKSLWLLLDPEPAGLVSLQGDLIENLYVLPEAQGRGCGTRLLRFAVSRCRRPRLWVLSSNQFAYDWYIRSGFIPTGKKKVLSDSLFERELVRKERAMYIETPRLLLRHFTMEDFPALWDILGDPETMAHVARYTQEEAREFLRTFCVERTPPGACAAVLRESGQLIGYLLCNQIDAPGIWELGWIFNRRFWRQGYAYEAAAALTDHLFRDQGAHKVVAETEDALRSLPLMEKLGLRREGVFRQHCRSQDGQWRDLFWYGLLREEYLAEPGRAPAE